MCPFTSQHSLKLEDPHPHSPRPFHGRANDFLSICIGRGVHYLRLFGIGTLLVDVEASCYGPPLPAGTSGSFVSISTSSSIAIIPGSIEIFFLRPLFLLHRYLLPGIAIFVQIHRNLDGEVPFPFPRRRQVHVIASDAPRSAFRALQVAPSHLLPSRRWLEGRSGKSGDSRKASTQRRRRWWTRSADDPPRLAGRGPVPWRARSGRSWRCYTRVRPSWTRTDPVDLDGRRHGGPVFATKRPAVVTKVVRSGTRWTTGRQTARKPREARTSTRTRYETRQYLPV